MVKLVVGYGQPEDPSAFDAHYVGTHIPLVEKIPNLRRFESGKVIGAPDGSSPPFYYLAELWFDDPEQLGAAMGSPEGQAAGADVETFASGGATLMIAET
ncbi:MAG TPA: EthD family reductase [Solirubrobacteraceae bacterium]|nr:EthD family reductase [Solirubrobacteraceae bacterium]